MADIDYYRLEYNEKQGVFQFDSYSKRKDEQYGWETIAMVISLDDLKKFVSTVTEKYPTLNSRGKGETFPTANEVKKLYNLFIGISVL
jgi:hypothetical protein